METSLIMNKIESSESTLTKQQNAGNKTKGVVAHERLYEELSGCQIDHIHVKNRDINFYQMTQPSEKQEELLNRLQLIISLKAK